MITRDPYGISGAVAPWRSLDAMEPIVERNITERDAEMRGIIDGVFEAPVSESVFGGMNVYAIANGLPVWCNLMMAVMDEIDTTFTREQKLTNPRISKYTAKYQKYQKK